MLESQPKDEIGPVSLRFLILVWPISLVVSQLGLGPISAGAAFLALYIYPGMILVYLTPWLGERQLSSLISYGFLFGFSIFLPAAIVSFLYH